MVTIRAIMVKACMAATAAGMLAGSAARADDLDPVAPAVFLPAGFLGLQIGTSWETTKKTPGLSHFSCRHKRGQTTLFDEVCFFQTANRVAGAPIHDGFMARKGDRVVLIGTGISIKDPDDPVAEAVMRQFQDQVHAGFQQVGDDVLFVILPDKLLSARELDGYSQEAPALLVELEPKGRELAVFYGYLAPVHAFSELIAD